MDLRSWLLDAHTDLHARLSRQVIDVVPTERWAEQADGGGSSIAWMLLHLTRHQDLALTTAIRNHPPLYLAHRDALSLASAPTSTGIAELEDPTVSAALSPGAIVDYIDAVFLATHEWLHHLNSLAMDSIPDTTRRLEDLAVLTHGEFDWLFALWGRKTVGWFVHWPIFGHAHSHVGEAISVRNRMGLSPF